MKRQCGNCGGAVINHIKTFKLKDKDGKDITVRGLGTWSCVNKCKKRKKTVKRFIGSGHENESINGKIRDEYIREVTVIRPILVTAA